ncbi:hypothetical protein HY988_06840 [Candidatus Micrarchaeota archaeon]|nr:hypothetical protein [Candidatus Micrarchaeota archaeon]
MNLRRAIGLNHKESGAVQMASLLETIMGAVSYKPNQKGRALAIVEKYQKDEIVHTLGQLSEIRGYREQTSSKAIELAKEILSEVLLRKINGSFITNLKESIVSNRAINTAYLVGKIILNEMLRLVKGWIGALVFGLTGKAIGEKEFEEEIERLERRNGWTREASRVVYLSMSLVLPPVVVFLFPILLVCDLSQIIRIEWRNTEPKSDKRIKEAASLLPILATSQREKVYAHFTHLEDKIEKL